MPIVKNETTVSDLVYESFLQTSIPPLISIFYAKEGEGGSRLFVQNFWSHSTEKLRWGTLQCIRKFWVSKNFIHQREREGGGEYHVSPSKTFYLTVPKNFVGEHFGVSENFGYRKILCIREGGGITFSVKNFLSHSTKKFRLGTLRCFRKFRVSQNFMHKKRISLNSVENFLSHSAENFVRESYCFWENFWFRKVLWMKRGYHAFPSKVFGLTVPKNFVKEPFSVSLISDIKNVEDIS